MTFHCKAQEDQQRRSCVVEKNLSSIFNLDMCKDNSIEMGKQEHPHPAQKNNLATMLTKMLQNWNTGSQVLHSISPLLFPAVSSQLGFKVFNEIFLSAIPRSIFAKPVCLNLWHSSKQPVDTKNNASYSLNMRPGRIMFLYFHLYVVVLVFLL